MQQVADLALTIKTRREQSPAGFVCMPARALLHYKQDQERYP
jgi:hypothetical protein